MTDPFLLYHYTDAKGLTGIVESQTLWATNADFLNDAQQLRFGRQELHDALCEEANALSPPDDESGDANYSRATVMRSAADELDPALRQYHSVYLACLCGAGDLLSQWRSYGGPGGYAVGFRAPELQVGLPGAKLVQVRYGDTAKREAIAKVLRSIAPRPVGHPAASGYARAQQIVLPALAGIKHPAFKEEHEWRLVVVTDQQGHVFGPARWE